MSKIVRLNVVKKSHSTRKELLRKEGKLSHMQGNKKTKRNKR